MEDIETYEVHHITNLLTKSPSQLIGYSSTNNLKFQIGSFECPPYAPLNLYVDTTFLRLVPPTHRPRGPRAPSIAHGLLESAIETQFLGAMYEKNFEKL